MRKILPVLMGISLLVTLLLPMVALAQEEIPEKCQIRVRPDLKDADKNIACPAVGSESVYKTEYCNGAECLAGKRGVSGAICCLFSTINYATNWIFTILILVAMIMVLIGGFNFLTAAGSEEKVTAGRNYIMYAAIGLAIALLARAVPVIVKFLVAPGV